MHRYFVKDTDFRLICPYLVRQTARLLCNNEVTLNTCIIQAQSPASFLDPHNVMKTTVHYCCYGNSTLANVNLLCQLLSWVLTSQHTSPTCWPHTHTDTHKHKQTCTHTRAHTHTHTNIHTRTRTRIHTDTNKHKRTHTHTYAVYARRPGQWTKSKTISMLCMLSPNICTNVISPLYFSVV